MTGPTVVYGVGATKAGTSWLYDYLAGHPETGLQPFKEMHFWQFKGCLPRKIAIQNVEADIARASGNYLKAKEKGDASWMARVSRNASAYWALMQLHQDPSLARYLQIMEHGADAPKVVADITPAYAMADVDTLKAMQDIGRETRFVYLLRDPVARLWSNIRMNAGKGEGASDRATALFEKWANGGTPGLEARSDYAGALDRLMAAVPKDYLYIGFYEELFTQEAVDALCQFLGLSVHPGDFDRAVWASEPIDLPQEAQARAYARLRPQYNAVARHLGRIPPAWDKTLKEAAR